MPKLPIVQMAVVALLSGLSAPTLADAALDCTKLKQLECMTERKCVRVRFSCEATTDPCEIAWQELHGTQASCEAMTNCRFIPREPCYCPPNVVCKCGGGAPDRCRLGG
jgi:hypothetical protein